MARRESALYLKVCACVNELTFVRVNHQSVVSEEIGSKDRFLNICKSIVVSV